MMCDQDQFFHLMVWRVRPLMRILKPRLIPLLQHIKIEPIRSLQLPLHNSIWGVNIELRELHLHVPVDYRPLRPHKLYCVYTISHTPASNTDTEWGRILCLIVYQSQLPLYLNKWEINLFMYSGAWKFSVYLNKYDPKHPKSPKSRQRDSFETNEGDILYSSFIYCGK